MRKEITLSRVYFGAGLTSSAARPAFLLADKCEWLYFIGHIGDKYSRDIPHYTWYSVCCRPRLGEGKGI